MQEFETWFFGCDDEQNSMRAEYFYQDVLDEMTDLTKMNTMRDWLKAAFEAGKKSTTESNKGN